jgi:putative hydrolase of the HAD superfamily
MWEIYACARNSVELYPDALPALEQLRTMRPVASLTNGNADLERIGLHMHFAHQISARDIGVAKPDARIFLAAAERLGVAPEQILHIGDDPELDVVGARDAGLRTAWINRAGHPWPGALGPKPDLDLRDLAALVEWLGRHVAG